MKKLLLLISGLLLFNSVFSTTFTVTSLNDTGAGSLRQAITNANADATATIASPHIINATGITGTITLATVLPDVSRHMTINGPTSGTLTVTCPTTANFRVFNILISNTVSINNLTISNGKASFPGGGGINNAGTLSLNNCTISNCKMVIGDWTFGGGIYTKGDLSITNCKINNNYCVNGGGICVAGGSTTINNSTINNNSSDGTNGGGMGGGVYVSAGSLTINNSTISGNTTIYYGSGGAGVYTLGTTTINNSTINNNSADGNGGGISGNATLVNCTISGNTTTSIGNGQGGGVYGAGVLTNCTIVNNTSMGVGAGYNGTGQINNSIIVGNTNNSSGNLDDVIGNVTSKYGHNIFGGTPTVSGNTQNHTGALISEVLNPALSDNGGATKTHALISCSYAVNTGTIQGAPTSDQRGIARLDSIDIGAFESPVGTLGKPFIAKQAIGPIICEGAPASMTLIAFGSNIDYQWQSNPGTGVYSNITDNAIYSGANSAILSISSSTGLLSYQYKCVISNTACSSSQTSNATPLTVRSAPSITVDLKDFSICSGAYVHPNYTASGGILSETWQVDKGSGFVNVTGDAYHSGVPNGYFMIGPGNPVLSGNKYRVIIGNNCGPNDTSRAATLTYYTNLALVSSPTSSTICSGGNTSFTVATTGTGVTYQWQENSGAGFVNITDGGVYSNSTTSTLNITGATKTMNSYQYMCIMKNPCNMGGINCTPATLTIQGPGITSQSNNQVTCNGFATSFNVVATASENITYHWQLDNGSSFNNISDNSTYSGTTSNTLTINNPTLAMNNYRYRCMLTTPSCTTPVFSANDTLTVNTAPIVTTQPVNKTSWNNGSVSFDFVASGIGLYYKWQLKKPSDPDFANINDGTTYSNSTSSNLTVLNPDASMNGYQYRCIVQSSNCPSSGLLTNVVTLSVSQENICMVTVDNASGKNLIVFEKPANLSTIDSFKVYREGAITNQYDLIGRVHKSAMSTLLDQNSDPTQQPYLYKIAVKDISGITSPLSSAHKTMHLTINKGIGNTWNLIWTAYQGITVNSYNIYRGLDVSSLTLINTVSGNITSYTDNNAPNSSNIYYQIEIVPSTACNPTAKLAAFASVKSNIAETQKVTGIYNSTAGFNFEMYPNPAKDLVTINGLPANSIITVYDISGHAIKHISENVSTINIEDLNSGMYILEVKNDLGTSRMPLVVE